jgi:prephenate dehydrogenase
MLGMRVLRMTPAAHDRAVAAVSHLPHVLSALLMMLPRGRDLALAASGFRDMTRLAAGPPEVWRDIILTNRGELLRAIGRLEMAIRHVSRLIAESEAKKIELFLNAAKKRRGLLPGWETPCLRAQAR